MATTDSIRDTVSVRIVPNTTARPKGKLADAELRFAVGPLAGLKLLGFAIWEGRAAPTVTFPARQYSLNGERRSCALLRPTADHDRRHALRDLILQAYAELEASNGRGRVVHMCECCGEPAGDGNALCPACQTSR